VMAAYDAHRKLTSWGMQKVSFCLLVDTGGRNIEYVERNTSSIERVYRYSNEYLANATLVVFGGPGETWGYPGILAETYDRYVDQTIKEISEYADVIKGLCVRDLDKVEDDGQAEVSNPESVVSTFVSWVSLADSLRRSKL